MPGLRRYGWRGGHEPVQGLPAAYAIERMLPPAREHAAFAVFSLRLAPELIIILPLFALYQFLFAQQRRDQPDDRW